MIRRDITSEIGLVGTIYSEMESKDTIRIVKEDLFSVPLIMIFLHTFVVAQKKIMAPITTNVKASIL